MSKQPTTDQIIQMILTQDALVRYNRIKLYNKERAKQIENELMKLYKDGKIKRQIDEDEFIEFLGNIGEKNEPRVVVMRRRNEGDL